MIDAGLQHVGIDFEQRQLLAAPWRDIAALCAHHAYQIANDRMIQPDIFGGSRKFCRAAEPGGCRAQETGGPGAPRESGDDPLLASNAADPAADLVVAAAERLAASGAALRRVLRVLGAVQLQAARVARGRERLLVVHRRILLDLFNYTRCADPEVRPHPYGRSGLRTHNMALGVTFFRRSR